MKDFFTRFLNRLDLAEIVGFFLNSILVFITVLIMFEALDKEYEIQERKIEQYHQDIKTQEETERLERQARNHLLQTHYPNMKQNE